MCADAAAARGVAAVRVPAGGTHRSGRQGAALGSVRALGLPLLLALLCMSFSHTLNASTAAATGRLAFQAGPDLSGAAPQRRHCSGLLLQQTPI